MKLVGRAVLCGHKNMQQRFRQAYKASGYMEGKGESLCHRHCVCADYLCRFAALGAVPALLHQLLSPVLIYLLFCDVCLCRFAALGAVPALLHQLLSPALLYSTLNNNRASMSPVSSEDLPGISTNTHNDSTTSANQQPPNTQLAGQLLGGQLRLAAAALVRYGGQAAKQVLTAAVEATQAAGAATTPARPRGEGGMLGELLVANQSGALHESQCGLWSEAVPGVAMVDWWLERFCVRLRQEPAAWQEWVLGKLPTCHGSKHAYWILVRGTSLCRTSLRQTLLMCRTVKVKERFCCAWRVFVCVPGRLRSLTDACAAVAPGDTAPHSCPPAVPPPAALPAGACDRHQLVASLMRQMRAGAQPDTVAAQSNSQLQQLVDLVRPLVQPLQQSQVCGELVSCGRQTNRHIPHIAYTGEGDA